MQGGAEPSSRPYSYLKDNYHNSKKHCSGSLFAFERYSAAATRFRRAEAVDQEPLTRVALLSISCF